MIKDIHTPKGIKAPKASDSSGLDSRKLRASSNAF